MIKTEDFNELQNILYSAVIADALDETNDKIVRNNAMDNMIRPLSSEMKVMGRAFTILAVDTYEQPKEPYKLELEAIDNLKKGDVVIVKSNKISAFWGELLTTAAIGHNCRGAIIDGFTRDAKEIIKMAFPTFASGFIPYDSKGRTEVIAYKVPIKSSGVLINPGDIIFADYDGIVVIPKKIEDIVIKKAIQKLNKEKEMKEKLLMGASIKKLFDEYHIL